MSKPVTIGQSHNVISILANNTNWDALDSESLQKVINNPKKVGEEFTAFLKNGGKIMVGSKILTIDRTEPFDPVKFIGEGWKVLNDETDTRSTSITELDLAKVSFETMLRTNETSVKGEEKLKRLKKVGHIRLDAKIFQTIWENKHLIPESWKEKVTNTTRFIYFDGTVLQRPNGRRYVLCLYWSGGEWLWGVSWLESDWRADGPSAVLVK